MASNKPEEKQELTLDEMQKQIAEALAAANKAREEAEALLEQAKLAAEPVTQAKQSAEEKAAADAHMEELVEVYLFRDSGKYKDDVFVAVNGENVLIKRGKTVKIKRKFAEVLENSKYQDDQTADLIEAEGRKYDEMERRLGG